MTTIKTVNADHDDARLERGTSRPTGWSYGRRVCSESMVVRQNGSAYRCGNVRVKWTPSRQGFVFAGTGELVPNVELMESE